MVSNMSVEKKSFDSGEMYQLMAAQMFYSPVKLDANLQKTDKVRLFSFLLIKTLKRLGICLTCKLTTLVSSILSSFLILCPILPDLFESGHSAGFFI